MESMGQVIHLASGSPRTAVLGPSSAQDDRFPLSAFAWWRLGNRDSQDVISSLFHVDFAGESQVATR
ncbi:hypothetical protein ACFPRL_16810 [Pseudoclavibacter helvolus]